MVRILFTTVVRNFRRNPLFSLINIFGLTLGIASFILITLFVISELSYDRFNEKADRIYRLALKAKIGNTIINQTNSSARIFREMSEKYPEIETGVKFINWQDAFLRKGDQTFSEMLMFVDSTVFNVFTLPLVSGTPETALNRPNTMLLSETTARKFFGSQDPVGQVLEADLTNFGTRSFEVTGVYQDIPVNSHVHFNVMASLSTFPDLLSAEGWSANNFVTYFLLKPGASAEELQGKFEKYTRENFGEERYKSFIEKGNYWEFFLQPLTSIHLYSDLNGEFEPNGNIRYVYIFIVIAFFVLIIACINFMNLSTAKSTLRAREVGIKKSAGSSRVELIRQFLMESVTMTFVALVLALILVKLLLPVYSGWLGRDLTFNLLSNPLIIPGLVVFGFVIGIVAGIYPSFFMASYSPTRVLKAQVLSETKGIGLRNILVIIQFGASIFLIICTLIIGRQLNFIQTKDVGFVKENILILRTPTVFSQVRRSFGNEIRQQAGVIGMSASNSLPGFGFSNLGFGVEGIDNWFTLNIIRCDTGFATTLGFQLNEGRFFSSDFATDSSGIVLNETAVRVFGLSNPIGTKMFDGGDPRTDYHVIGVVKDFNYETVHSEIRPMGLVNLNGGEGDLLSIRFEAGNGEQIAAFTKQTWDLLLPGVPFLSSYMEDDYKNLYRNEIQTKQVFTLLATLAIIVAILGLVGLASFMAQRRIREIAVRKISGARIDQIIQLLTGKFIKWVLISFLLASPVAWWVMNQWLEDFAYRISLNAWVFILSGAIAILLVIITVGLVTFKAATANPAESMKYE